MPDRKVVKSAPRVILDFKKVEEGGLVIVVLSVWIVKKEEVEFGGVAAYGCGTYEFGNMIF